MPVLHGLECTATISLGRCARCTGDSSKQLPTSPAPDAGVRHTASTNSGGSRDGPGVSDYRMRTPLGINIAGPDVLSMYTGCPCPRTMAEALGSLGSPLGRPCGLRSPPRVNMAELLLLCAHARAACPCAVAQDVGSLGSPVAWSCGLRTQAPCPGATAEALECLGPPLGRPCRLRTPQGVNITSFPCFVHMLRPHSPSRWQMTWVR